MNYMYLIINYCTNLINLYIIINIVNKLIFIVNKLNILINFDHIYFSLNIYSFKNLLFHINAFSTFY